MGAHKVEAKGFMVLELNLPFEKYDKAAEGHLKDSISRAAGIDAGKVAVLSSSQLTLWTTEVQLYVPAEDDSLKRT